MTSIMFNAVPLAALRRAIVAWGGFAAGCVLIGAVAAGCSSGPKNFLNDNDRLRRENLELARKVESLKTALERRGQQVQTLESKLGRPTGDTNADVPVLSAIKLGRYSGPIDTNADGQVDTLRLYVQTHDAQGRFLVTAATAQVQVVVLAADESPRVLADHAFTSAEFDAAYRSGFMGTHYTLDVPITKAELAAAPTVTALVKLTDGDSGIAIDTQRTFDLP